VSAVEPQTPRREPPASIRGYRQDEVVSALQKAIRRGLEDDALYWAVELDESGWGEYCFSRLFVILSEDVGLAEPLMPAVIAALYENWQALRRRRRGRSTGRATSQGAEKLPLVHAVLLLARARKSQIVVNATVCHTHLAENGIRAKEVPDVSLDRHTLAGKKRGRGWEHFMDESSLLAHRETGELSSEPVLPDPYRERARSVLVKPETSVPSREHDEQGSGPRRKDDRPADPRGGRFP
jgi:replication-associated recombination protein RarA